jgi:hypothetical protein
MLLKHIINKVLMLINFDEQMIMEVHHVDYLILNLIY